MKLSIRGCFDSCRNKKGDPCGSPYETLPACLQRHHVLCLPALGALYEVELHRLAFLERTKTVRLDGAVVHEHVLTVLAADEAVTFGIVEPLHSSLFHNVAFCFLLLELELRWIGTAGR